MAHMMMMRVSWSEWAIVDAIVNNTPLPERTFHELWRVAIETPRYREHEHEWTALALGRYRAPYHAMQAATALLRKSVYSVEHDPETETEFLFRLAYVDSIDDTTLVSALLCYATDESTANKLPPVQGVPYYEADIQYRLRISGGSGFRLWLDQWRSDLTEVWDAVTVDVYLQYGSMRWISHE